MIVILNSFIICILITVLFYTSHKVLRLMNMKNSKIYASKCKNRSLDKTDTKILNKSSNRYFKHKIKCFNRNWIKTIDAHEIKKLFVIVDKMICFQHIILYLNNVQTQQTVSISYTSFKFVSIPFENNHNLYFNR